MFEIEKKKMLKTIAMKYLVHFAVAVCRFAVDSVFYAGRVPYKLQDMC